MKNLLFLSLFIFLFQFTFSEETENVLNIQLSVYFWKDHKEIDIRTAKEMEGKTIIPDLVVYYASNGEMKALELFKGMQSQWFDYTGPSDFVLHKRHENKDGEYVYTPYLNVSLVEYKEKALLFIYNTDSIKQMFAIKLSTSDLSPGGILFFNMTKEPVVINVGNSKSIGISQFQSKVYQLEGEKVVRMVNVAVKKSEEWDIAYRSRLVMKNNERYVSFFSNEAGNYKLLTLRSL
jgi:hypothetical protein